MSDQFCSLPSGIRLCYRTYGTGTPIVLIAGITLQLHSWPQPLIDALVEAGFQPIVFDNRDCGRSSFPDTEPPAFWRLAVNRVPKGQYTLTDMANDTVGLMDTSGWKKRLSSGCRWAG